MKKILYILLLLSIDKICYSQTINQVDSLLTEMCQSIADINEVKDDEKVKILFNKHLPEFNRLIKVETQRKADSIRDLVHFRLQKNCLAYLQILTKIEENKGDWKSIKEKPKALAREKQCNNLFKGGTYYYKEYDGKIVSLIIKDGFWEETFEDGTKSKLAFIPKDGCEFSISFIVSNNEKRKNYSIPGDIYNYGVYAYQDKIYNLWVFNKGIYYTFRLYEK